MEADLNESNAGTLFVVSTPIGNMGDFSFRAVDTLRSVSAILAEDTRHTRHLLERYEIDVPLVAYHEHNEAKTTPRLVERLVSGESLALVSDAGTPLLSDPYQQSASLNLNPSARVTIGKRISNRIFLTYARSLSSSQRDQIILLEFDESETLSWVLSQNEDRTYALEVRKRHAF